MSQYIIEGKHTISGEIKIDGAKNSVLPILAATIINGGITVLTNCPDLTDVRNTLLILESLGCKTEFVNDRITVDSSNITSTTILPELAGSLRSSITFVGALLARFGEVTTAHPGGCATLKVTYIEGEFRPQNSPSIYFILSRFSHNILMCKNHQYQKHQQKYR